MRPKVHTNFILVNKYKWLVKWKFSLLHHCKECHFNKPTGHSCLKQHMDLNRRLIVGSFLDLTQACVKMKRPIASGMLAPASKTYLCCLFHPDLVDLPGNYLPPEEMLRTKKWNNLYGIPSIYELCKTKVYPSHKSPPQHTYTCTHSVSHTLSPPCFRLCCISLTVLKYWNT